MSEKYFCEINNNKDIVKFKLQLGAILLKLNGYNSSISTINDTIEDQKEKINETEKGDYISIDKKHNVENQAFRFKRTVHSYKIIEIAVEDDFNTDMIINFSNDIYFKYFNVKNYKLRLEHEYQLYNSENLFYKKIIKKSDGIVNLNDNTMIMNNEFNINIKDDFKKLKIILMLHRVNREGYGNINLDIFDAK